MRSFSAPGRNAGGYSGAAGSGGRVLLADPAGRKSLRRTGVAAAASDDEQQIRRVSVTPSPPGPTPGAGLARPRAPPAPPAAALAPSGRDAMSHGATHSPVPAAGARPGPEGTRGREVWTVGWWQSRTGELRVSSWPRLSLAFSGPSQGMGWAERPVGCWVLAPCLLARGAASAVLGRVGSGVSKSQQRYSDQSSCGPPE